MCVWCVCGGGGGGGGAGGGGKVQSTPPFDSKFHFDRKLWINLINYLITLNIHNSYILP